MQLQQPRHSNRSSLYGSYVEAEAKDIDFGLCSDCRLHCRLSLLEAESAIKDRRPVPRHFHWVNAFRDTRHFEYYAWGAADPATLTAPLLEELLWVHSMILQISSISPRLNIRRRSNPTRLSYS